MKTDFQHEFRNHKVTKYRDGPSEYLRWQEPGSSNCRIDFLVNGPYLLVCGDLGDSVFQWSQNIELAWVAGCHNGYILKKCQASEVGRDFREWDMDTAQAWLEEHDKEEGSGFDLEKAKDSLGHFSVETLEEWREWLFEFGHDYLGDDCGEWWDIGMVPHIRFRMQMDGLRRAIVALKASRNERDPR